MAEDPKKRNIGVAIEASVIESASAYSVSTSKVAAIGAAVDADTAAAIDALRETPLLLQTVVETGLSVPEGVIVEAVSLPWFEIVRMLESDPGLAMSLDARLWEEIIAGAYTKSGFDEVVLTPRSGDLGRDVIATKRGIGTVRVIDQVKAYKPGHLVTADDVRALLGVLYADGASKGFLTTTSDFAPRLKSDSLLVPFFPSRLELVNGPALISRLSEISRK